MDIEIVEVRENRDPTGTGRVKVRAYNKENDEQNIPDEGLRWAHPVLPITSISSGGIGHKPPAPPIGSRLLCVFLPEDHDRQYPYYFGCIVRSEKVDEKGVQQRDTRTGDTKAVAGNEAPDTPGGAITTA